MKALRRGLDYLVIRYGSGVQGNRGVGQFALKARTEEKEKVGGKDFDRPKAGSEFHRASAEPEGCAIGSRDHTSLPTDFLLRLLSKIPKR